MILPTVLYLLCFQLYPIFESIRLSFTDTMLISPGWEYIGLENYRYLLFEDGKFWPIVLNSFRWIGLSLITQMALGLIMAMLLNQKVVARGALRGLGMVPWVMPVVVVGIMFKWLFDYYYGLVNITLQDWGIISQSINWFGDEKWVWPTLILSATWKGFPYPMIMLLAGLKGISGELYESARVDGANAWQCFWRITLPALRPVLFVTGLVQIITGWTKFEMIWVLTNGGPGFATSILPTYVYANSFNFYKMGLGSAVAVISMLILFAFILVYYKFVRTEED